MSEKFSMDGLIEFTTKAVERITNHINVTEPLIKAARKRWKKPSLYKTEICDHWRNKRKCIYGMRCWYAHGAQELRHGSTSSSTMSSMSTMLTSGYDEAGSAGGGSSIYNGGGNGVAIEAPPVRPAITAGVPSYDSNIENGGGTTTGLVPYYRDDAPPFIPQSYQLANNGGGGVVEEPRPAFLVSFEGPLQFAAMAAPAPQLQSPQVNTSTPPPPTSTEQTVQPQVIQPQMGYDFFRSSTAGCFNFASSGGFNFGTSGLNFGTSGVNFGTSGVNFGISGFNFPTVSPSYATNDNLMNALTSSFVIPAKSVWLS